VVFEKAFVEECPAMCSQGNEKKNDVRKVKMDAIDRIFVTGLPQLHDIFSDTCLFPLFLSREIYPTAPPLLRRNAFLVSSFPLKTSIEALTFLHIFTFPTKKIYPLRFTRRHTSVNSTIVVFAHICGRWNETERRRATAAPRGSRLHDITGAYRFILTILCQVPKISAHRGSSATSSHCSSRYNSH